EPWVSFRRTKKGVCKSVRALAHIREFSGKWGGSVSKYSPWGGGFETNLAAALGGGVGMSGPEG
ncbi:MAG TPA: hypothetical protein DDZ83_08245, partial [Nitrospinae bacterium]|nr:hypothetical protein [Nitrospinota bacterium]